MDLREQYQELKDDYETALNYRRLTDGFPDLKARFFRVRDEYYSTVLDHEVVRPSCLELRTEET
jgi:hypothetical protein